MLIRDRVLGKPWGALDFSRQSIDMRGEGNDGK
jgi:hypothetical protein